MRSIFFLPFISYLFILCIACSGSADRGVVALENVAPSAPPTERVIAHPAAASGGEYAERKVMAEETSTSHDESASGGDISRTSVPAPVVVTKIIKNADIAYQVNDNRKTRRQIIQTVKAFNGRIATEIESNSSATLTNTFTIRIDAARFDTLLEKLMEHAIYVEQKHITSEDITEQYVDLQSRLKARKAVEERFLSILKQAKTIKDILEVENQLRVLREDIDAAEGKLRYMDNRVSESTVNLRIYEQLPYSRTPERGFFGQIAKAFGDGWRELLDFIIGIVSMWSSLLILGVVIAIIRKLWLRRKRNNLPNIQDKQDKQGTQPKQDKES